MKYLLKKIENKEKFFKKLLEIVKRQDIYYERMEELEVKVKDKIYHCLYFHETQAIIIDGIFHDATDAVLVAEFIANAISYKYELNSSDIINTMFISVYIDNYNYINLRAFNVNSFSFELQRYCEPEFPTIHQLTKSQVANIIQGANNEY